MLLPMLTFGVEEILLGSMLVENAGKCEAILFGEVLGVRYLDYLRFVVAAMV